MQTSPRAFLIEAWFLAAVHPELLDFTGLDSGFACSELRACQFPALLESCRDPLGAGWGE